MRDKPETGSRGTPGALHAWAQLVRAPNLATVPGDPLAGYLLAAGASAVPDPRLATVVGASLLLYSAGTMLNDVYDVAIDRTERPSRPIPSGRISKAAAQTVGFGLLLTGVALAFLASRLTGWAASLLALCVWGYDEHAKKAPILGPLVLGACRSLNLVLGASLVSRATLPLYAGSIAISCYIVAVSFLARGEMTRRRLGWEGWLPALMLVGAMAALVRLTPVVGTLKLCMTGSLLFAFVAVSAASMHLQHGRPAAASIGGMIGALIPLQAALALAAGGPSWSVVVGAGLLFLWPLHRLLSRWFYAS